MIDRSDAYYVWERWAIDHALRWARRSLYFSDAATVAPYIDIVDHAVTESLTVLEELFTLDPIGLDERDQDQHGLWRHASP